MVIICDSREQRCLSFDGLEGIEKIEEMGLSFGDYSAIVHGNPVPIVFERKGISDLFGTMTIGYERFKKEMQRAKESNMKLILAVEGTYTDVYQGISHSQFSGQSMVKKLAMLQVKYDLETWYCESRRVMARRIVDTFSAVERCWAKESPNKITPNRASDVVRLSAPDASALPEAQPEV